METKVTTYYLEMTAATQLNPKRFNHPNVTITQAEIPLPELNRFLYTAVGGSWHWTARLPWTYQQWFDYLNRPELETWVMQVSGTPAGYFELETQTEGNVELVYFGLLSRFVGQGLGGPLLTTAIERAWAMSAARVWVHTCTLDHPAALANYQARGFKIYKEETDCCQLPHEPLGPWPGANRHPPSTGSGCVG